MRHIKRKLLGQPTISVDKRYAIPLWARRKDFFWSFLEGNDDKAEKAKMQSSIRLEVL